MMKNESGRSMVEMLGVLAIIGVLSVGGIAGYSMAMRKYRANELVAAINMVAMQAMVNNAATDQDDAAYSNGCTLTGTAGTGAVTVAKTDNCDDSVLEEAKKLLGCSTGTCYVGGDSNAAEITFPSS